jgi:hypothetical protein
VAFTSVGIQHSHLDNIAILTPCLDHHLFRDEIRFECITRNLHQHASGELNCHHTLLSLHEYWQGFVSLRRIERYLISQEIPAVPAHDPDEDTVIALNSATITWPQARFHGSTPSSEASTPARNKFILADLNLKFPVGGLSLICGRLGSGKTLLLLGEFTVFQAKQGSKSSLLGMLGESDLLTGQIIVPRSPPDSIATFSAQEISDEDWIVSGICGYVPQAAWLQNASIKGVFLQEACGNGEPHVGGRKYPV